MKLELKFIEAGVNRFFTEQLNSFYYEKVS